MLPLIIIPEMFFLFFLMIVNGEPFRYLLLGRLKLFSDLDPLQIIILDVYLGGFFLYILAILPLQLFSWPIVLAFTIACFLISIGIHLRSISQLSSLSRIRASLTRNRRMSFEYALVFTFFVFFLLFNLASVSGFVYGSVRDESIHSLSVQVILENKQIPLTLQPYVAEGLIYPQASHVILAFASYMLNLEVPQAVFYVSILFKSLTVFGAYFLAKKLSSRRAYYLGLPIIFVFISSWPLYITWGGNPFLVGFPLFLISLGLLFSIAHDSGENSLPEIVTIGLLFGYCATIIISYLETIFAAGLLIVGYWLITRNKRLRGVSALVAILLISLVPLSPFLFRFFDFYSYTGHNIGIPSDFSQWPQQQFSVTQAFQWIFSNLSPHFWLSTFMMLLLAGFAILMWRTRDYRDIKAQTTFALVIFAAAGLLSIVAFFLPADFNVISWGHQGAILVVPINMILITFYMKINDICRGHRFDALGKVFSKDMYSGVLLAFLILLLLNAPFIYNRLVVDPQTLTGGYGLYAVTTQGDRDLMLWMKSNLTTAAVVLVNPDDPGLFIPAVSHQRIVFPWSGSSYAVSYQTLVNLTSDDVLNDTTYDLMKKYNITHVFVGAAATGWWVQNFRWNPLLFLGNPNFRFVETFGSAYLFQFTYTNPRVAFTDDFESANWSATGWQAKSEGVGQGNVTTTVNIAYVSQGLRMTAQAAYTVTEWQYATYISRNIFVLNDSNVRLSFDFNATEGFSALARDTFAAIVSNVYGNQTYVITTPNGVYENYQHSRSLPLFGGSYAFDESISNLWRQAYNSSLPNPFVLRFVNWDLDGIQNVAYLGNVTVTTSPS